MKSKNQIIGILALSGIKGIGPAFIKKAVTSDMFLSPNFVAEIKSILSTSKKEIDEEDIFNQIEEAKNILYRCEEENIKIIPITSEDYPRQLKAIKDPPGIIYCKGNIELLYSNIICVVGTREPNENGAKIAERIGQYFSTNQWSICNGLVDGIDNHAIKFGGTLHSNVIGILAGGINYNEKKTLLKKAAENAEQVLQSGGLLISEMPLDKKEDTFSVVKSCRIQAGVSNGLFLVQSSLDGGSKFTTKAFCELPRPIAVINPVSSDFDLSSYEANKELVLNGRKGLTKFTDIKADKMQTTEIIIIKSRDDYSKFENLAKQQILNKIEKTLFD